LVNYNISVVTSSIDSHILKQATQTGSQDIVNFNISIVTSSIDSHILKQSTQTGSQDLVNYNISVVTSSIDSHILKQATQTGSQDLVNLGISTFTGSLRSEVNLIEAYTASLKGAAIVSSSQQIQNYNLFAVTSSANTFYGTQTITGAIIASASNGNIRIKGSTDGFLGAGESDNKLYLTDWATAAKGLIINLSTGAATFSDNIVMGTSGKGIDFSSNANAGGMTSELLNDYEEGTWTIGIEFGGASVGVTTVMNTGTYTKIGRQVTVNGSIGLSSKGSSAGIIEITGLPFTCGAGSSYHPPAILWLNNVTFANQYQARGLTSGTKVRIEEITEAGALTNIDNTNFANNSEVFISLTYFV
jgi:hypothetical protein